MWAGTKAGRRCWMTCGAPFRPPDDLGAHERALGHLRDRGPYLAGSYLAGSGGGNWAITRAPLQSSRA